MVQQLSDAEDCLFNIVIVGDSFVGKSKIIERFTKNEFSYESPATSGLDFRTKTVQQIEGKKVKAKIWDTSGLAKYRAVNYMHYRRVDGAVIVYDVTKKSSFENSRTWLREVRTHARSDVVVMITGNKCDMRYPREVSKEEAKRLTDKVGALFMEVSAREAVNVEEAFDVLLAGICRGRMSREEEEEE
ncbi:Ras-related protein Rab-11A [Rhynchospora pubera]|uniref:Ras-related protein Rab-11A n=1 Tax=Rhynchospora pubera TaxID=906938 RepID=A0AAV8HGL7_9POAL|nr:Ras-related protein Rab-11A [Rhynchospora pubera]